MKGKKGQKLITGIFLWIILGFIITIISVIFIFIGNTTYNQLMAQNETIQAAVGPGVNVTEVIDKHIGSINLAYSSLRWITLMLMIGMVLAILISSFLVKEHPAFFVLYLFLLIIAIVVSVPLSNVYETIYSSPQLSSSFVGFWGITFIFLNLHIWVTVVGFLAAIIMYVNMVRSRQGGLIS